MKMKKTIGIIALSLSAALAALTFAPAAAAQEPELTNAERAGVVVGYAELCQEFALKFLDDYRVDGLNQRLDFSAGFREQREKILAEYRGVDSIEDIDSFCRIDIEPLLRDWAKSYGITEGQ